MASLGADEAYTPLRDKRRDASKIAKKLTTGYTMWMDHIFARGLIGLVYALWGVGVLLYTLLQIVYVSTGRFLITTILTTIEAGVLLVAGGILAYLQWKTHKDLKSLRKLAAIGDESALTAKSQINGIRSRANIQSDWRLISTGLWAIVPEMVLVWCFYLGNGISDNFLNGVEDATPFPLMSTAIADITNYTLVMLIQFYIVAKFVVVLGVSLWRDIAHEANIKRLQVSSSADMKMGGAAAPISGNEAVAMAMPAGSRQFF